MRLVLTVLLICICVHGARAQLQVELKFKRLQYIAHEPVYATVKITNLAGRDVDLHDQGGQRWFGFEVTAGENQLIAPAHALESEAPLHIAAGQTVTRKVNLTPVYPVHDFGTYHIRGNIYFADLNKFFYSQTKVFQVTDARAIWQRTVGVPDGQEGAGQSRTYSLLSNRFPDHTSLYVRVEDKNSGVVFNTYSLGRVIAYDEPQVELDRANQLHVLHCSGPQTWAYAHIGLDGELLKQSTFLQTKTQPRLRHGTDGAIAVHGGTLDQPVPQSAQNTAPKLSARPPNIPQDD
ncbi:MAG: hypothetical protein M3Z64_12330 [Verrucomicrobiota bacterium]|nr:hypothetical protein [Verrucomicrobiota bacterium]